MAKSLKEQNRPYVWAITVANSAILWVITHLGGAAAAVMATTTAAVIKLVPLAVGVVVATVLNALLSSETKEQLVFLRRRHVLPSHRAFSVYAHSDPRVDVVALEKLLGAPLPTDPVEQSRTWYSKLYRQVEDEPAVSQVHRDYLLLRDYTGLAVLFLVLFGATALYATRLSASWALYLVFLLAQTLVVRHAAAQRGTRLVTTVLAQAAAKLSPKRSAKVRRK